MVPGSPMRYKAIAYSGGTMYRCYYGLVLTSNVAADRNIVPYGTSSLSFTIAAGPRQRSHSRLRVPRDSWPYFTLSDSIFTQSGAPGPRIYILPWQGGPVIPPGTGFPFRRLLRLAGLRWRYSAPPPHGPTLCYNRRPVGQSVLVSSTHLGLKANYVLVFLMVFFLVAFPPISYMHSSSPPFVLHALPISSSLTSSF
jgi:hypothetical protein